MYNGFRGGYSACLLFPFIPKLPIAVTLCDGHSILGGKLDLFRLFRGNGGLKTATTLCLSRLSGIQLSVRKWNAYIRAYKVHHIKHILYVSEAISFTDNELNLVISCFNPGITHTIADCI